MPILAVIDASIETFNRGRVLPRSCLSQATGSAMGQMPRLGMIARAGDDMPIEKIDRTSDQKEAWLTG